MEYLYVGEDADDACSSLVKFLGKIAVVPKLMSPLFSKGYHLYVITGILPRILSVTS